MKLTPGFACLAPLLFAAIRLAAQNTCTPVFDAMTKVVNTPSHIYNSITSASRKGRTSETIYADGAIFTKVRDSWTRSKMTPHEMLKQEEKNRQTSKYSCRHIQDEAVNGEPATVYMTHAETEDAKSDSRVWISKRSGLPLRQELDIDGGASAGKTHYSIRYEFGNVKPPVP